MSFVFRRSATAVASMVLVAGSAFAASPARAATCVTVPGSTPGTGVTIAGDDYRVPSVSHISVCAADGSIPFVDVQTSGGSCSAGCLAVVIQGSDVDSGGLTVSYRLDGVTTSQTVDPGGTGGPGDSCLLGVGSPEAPRSDCFFAVEPDQEAVDDATALVDDAVADVEDIVGDAGGDVNERIEDAGATADETAAEVDRIIQDLGGLEQVACDTIPSMSDPNTWEEVRFCDDPAGWVDMIVSNFQDHMYETTQPIRDILQDRPTPNEILAPLFCSGSGCN